MLLVVFVGEVVLCARWEPWYFRSGLVIYSRRVSAVGREPHLPAPSELEASFKSFLLPNLVFRAFSPDEIVFREKLLSIRLFSYSPLMHGHIEFRPLERAVSVQGRLNWFSLIFFVLFALRLPREGLLPLLPILCGLYALIYLIQAFRYQRVIKVLTITSAQTEAV